MHYGDRPPANAERVAKPDARAATRPVRVERVVDGDTVALADGRRVRIIGIDAPEIARRGTPGEAGGLAARRHLVTLLDGAGVQVRPGATPRDRYDRHLAYLALPDGSDVAARMLRAGHVVASPHPDNMQRAGRYLALEAEAREAGRGLWQHAAYQPRPARDAARFRNSYRQLRGRVTAVRVRASSAELAIAGGLRLHVSESVMARFDPDRLRALVDRVVLARGTVRQRDGAPVIHLRDPAQLTTRER